MKRAIAFILILLVLSSLLCPFAYARAGGGGGGFSGGGGGFFRSFRRIARMRDTLTNNYGTVGYILYLVICAVFLFIMGIAGFLTTLAFRRAQIKSKILLSKLGKKDPVWNPKKLDRHIKLSFYKIQKAWSDDKLSAVRHLLSDSLYEDFSQKLELNRKGNVINKLSKINLKKAYPISVQDRIGEDNDCVWYYIKASMVDLTYEVSTMQLLSDIKTPIPFVEYWRFCKKDGGWVLDRIMQQYEFEKSFAKSERPQ